MSDHNELERLAKLHGTDKRLDVHGYTAVYDRHFRNVRAQIKTVLELGVHRGGSIRMWRDYFPNAFVHGIDINPKYAMGGERIKFWLGSQLDESKLMEVVESCGGTVDLIVDDGAHTNEAQWYSFKLLWPHVTPGGYYIVEDVCCSYWSEYGNGASPGDDAPISKLMQLVHDVNFRGIRQSKKVFRSARRVNHFIASNPHELLPKYQDMMLDIEEISFASGTVLIKKLGA